MMSFVGRPLPAHVPTQEGWLRALTDKLDYFTSGQGQFTASLFSGGPSLMVSET